MGIVQVHSNQFADITFCRNLTTTHCLHVTEISLTFVNFVDNSHLRVTLKNSFHGVCSNIYIYIHILCADIYIYCIRIVSYYSLFCYVCSLLPPFCIFFFILANTPYLQIYMQTIVLYLAILKANIP